MCNTTITNQLDATEEEVVDVELVDVDQAEGC